VSYNDKENGSPYLITVIHVMGGGGGVEGFGGETGGGGGNPWVFLAAVGRVILG